MRANYINILSYPGTRIIIHFNIINRVLRMEKFLIKLDRIFRLIDCACQKYWMSWENPFRYLINPIQSVITIKMVKKHEKNNDRCINTQSVCALVFLRIVSRTGCLCLNCWSNSWEAARLDCVTGDYIRLIVNRNRYCPKHRLAWLYREGVHYLVEIDSSESRGCREWIFRSRYVCWDRKTMYDDIAWRI